MQSHGLARFMLGGMLVMPMALSAQQPTVNRYGNPARMQPAPTTREISARDLQIRLYQFADDSMQGRQVGRQGNEKGTDYIAAELKRLGLVPGGDNGTWFQVMPYHLRKYTDNSRLTVDGNPLEWNRDWVAVATPGQRAPRPVTNASVIWGGVDGDTSTQVTAQQAAGKVVVLAANTSRRSGVGPVFGGRGAGSAQAMRLADAAAIVRVDLDDVPERERVALNEPTVASMTSTPRAGPGANLDSLQLLKAQLALLAPQAQLRMTRDAAARLFGRNSIDGMQAGTTGGTVNAALHFVEIPTNYGRNVIGIIPGSDPALRHQYVALGAHNDHVGFTTPVDKDSLKEFNDQRMRLMMANGMVATPQVLSQIRVDMDSIRRVHPTPRLDSINNGADDDGSGSMALLEIAEAMQAMPVKPKRSTVFIWHTGEEAGLLGAAYFTRNPTIPLDSIVAQLNVDMIGRGRAEDIPGGGPDYLGVVGSFFDSKDLGETVAAVNRKQARPLQLDYRFDEPISWQGYNNIYGRSDHYHYALQGIPIAFFFTGLHGDYHQRTDEPEFIDYPHYARITSYIRDVAVEVGNGPRPRLNGTRPAKPRVIVP